jgi:hypothetical protein
MSAYYEIAEHVVFHVIAEHCSGGHKRHDDALAPAISRLDAVPSPAAPMADSVVGKRALRMGLD